MSQIITCQEEATSSPTTSGEVTTASQVSSFDASHGKCLLQGFPTDSIIFCIIREQMYVILICLIDLKTELKSDYSRLFRGRQIISLKILNLLTYNIGLSTRMHGASGL